MPIPARPTSPRSFSCAENAPTDALTEGRLLKQRILYFDEPTEVHTPTGSRRFWDGAIGGYNNPSVAAVVESLANGAARENVRLLSIGTGTVRRPRRNSERQHRDLRFEGGESPTLVEDLRKLAASILDDPPDAASFTAHIALGGMTPRTGEAIRKGPIVR